MSALADRPRVLLGVGTGFGAVGLAVHHLTTTARMFTLVCFGHWKSSQPICFLPSDYDVMG